MNYTMHIFGLIVFAGIVLSSPIGQNMSVTQKTGVINLYSEEIEKYRYNLTTNLETSTLKDENNYQDCLCTPFYKCKTRSKIYKTAIDGYNTNDKKIKADPCQKYFDVCCNETKINITVNLYLRSPDTTGSDGDCDGPENYSKEPNITHNDITKKPSDGHEGDLTEEHRKCGVWNKSGVGFRRRNAMDKESQFHEFPSTVIILEEQFSIDDESGLFYICVGSLIKTDVILVSSLTFKRKNITNLLVRAGKWGFNTEKEIMNHQDRRVKNIVTRYQQDSVGMTNYGVSLIFTEHSFSLQDDIQLICLPSKDDIIIKDTCYISFMDSTFSYDNYTIVEKSESGKTIKTFQYKVPTMKKVEHSIVPLDVCRRRGFLFNLQSFPNNNSTICTTDTTEKNEKYLFDFGSPLMCPYKNEPDRFVQVGLIFTCSWEDVYKSCLNTNISSVLNWINHELKNRRYY